MPAILVTPAIPATSLVAQLAETHRIRTQKAEQEHKEQRAAELAAHVDQSLQYLRESLGDLWPGTTISDQSQYFGYRGQPVVSAKVTIDGLTFEFCADNSGAYLESFRNERLHLNSFTPEKLARFFYEFIEHLNEERLTKLNNLKAWLRACSSRTDLNNYIKYANDFPDEDLTGLITAATQRVEETEAYQRTLSEQRARDLAEAERRKEAAQAVAAAAWFPFTIYELHYGITPGEGGPGTATAYVLHPKPDANGQWDVVLSHGSIIKSSFAFVARIDTLKVVDPTSNEAWAVCQAEYDDGVRIVTPPVGCERLTPIASN